MTTILICAGIALVIFAIVVSAVLVRLNNKIERLWRIHDNFVDTTEDVFNDLVGQVNDRIDMVNDQFHRVDDMFDDAHEIFWDIIDTLEIQLDTNEVLSDRLTELEDDSAYMWDVMEEHDDILYEFFEDEPEESCTCEENEACSNCKKKAWRPKKK